MSDIIVYTLDWSSSRTQVYGVMYNLPLRPFHSASKRVKTIYIYTGMIF